jgi:hypothetical protein
VVSVDNLCALTTAMGRAITIHSLQNAENHNSRNPLHVLNRLLILYFQGVAENTKGIYKKFPEKMGRGNE